MKLWKKAALAVAALIVVVLIALATWERATANTPAADPTRIYDVRIVRDTWGVPHIFGKTDADVAHGIGYAHAEDDFATLQEVFAATRGRAGALLGEDGAKADYAVHLLDARATARRQMAKLAPDTRALLVAYAAGFNKYAAQHPEEVKLGGLFPMTAEDVVAGFAFRAPFFFGLDRVIGSLAEGKLPDRDAPDVGERGSNGFAVAPSRSADGVTRLVNNSHQPWEGGVAWYELVVHSEQGWDFAGANFPGAPYPLMGHNKTLGWANTVNRPDLIDVYKLALSEDGQRYRFDGEWLPLQSKRVWLRVKMGPFTLPVPQTLHRSVHGPVIVNGLGAFAVRYAGIDDASNVEQYYRLNKAKDFAEWRSIMARQGVASTNFVYADAAGNIGMFYNARFPKRAAGCDWKGVLPGDTSKALWTGYLPFDGGPHLINPPSGYVANANNTPFIASTPADDLKRDAYSPLLGIENGMTNRAVRMIELFEGDASLTRDELDVLKMDKGYSRQSWVGPWMLSLLAVRDPKLADAQALLRQWDWTLDGKGRVDALAALMVAAGARNAYRLQALPDPAEKLTDAVDFITRHHGRLDPPLSALLRVERGKLSLPVYGGPDALRAIYWDRDEATGHLVADHGDSYVMMVEWPKDGRVASRSIHQFGAATTRPSSKHYGDQSPLFVREQYKPIWFEADDLKPHIAREYRP
ncbi:acylase [Sphingoaurantiacus capsulatus]|uniref:Acylase n=1 Tax=Sphingoaurantiacus capsulatus TaxID=1771310 RepID=A0ABV7XBH5_9SPHN